MGALVWIAAAAAAPSDRPLRTSVYIDPHTSLWQGDPPALALDRIAKSGATSARVTLYWYQVAPATRPTQWDPTNPADPNYRWGSYDNIIRSVVKRGLEPLITIMAAPIWAQGSRPEPPLNSYLPDPASFGDFAKAVATRYGGSFQGLPRVRWWQAWNEPNISLYLVPQLKGRPISPGWYRQLLNAFADAVHSVHPDNLVVVGGLAPFRDITPSVLSQDPDWGPLSFMRDLLCVSKSLQPTCSDRAKFDVWATHPYTSGGPLHQAYLPNDVSLGDLPEMRQVLDAAVKAGHVDSGGKAPQFWVTEFSWDTGPPDPQGVPIQLATRWVAEGLYRMWFNGVSLVTWLMLRDEPTTTSYLQSGLYFNGGRLAADKPKPLLNAFRFPVVALPTNGVVLVWGRTPAGRPARVIVERSRGHRWLRLGVVKTNRYGIFMRTYKTRVTGTVRARVIGRKDVSVPFGIPPVPDAFYNPFGSQHIDGP